MYASELDWVELPWPPSVNNYFKRNGRRTFLPKEALVFRDEVAKAFGKLEPETGYLHLMIDQHPKNNVRRDIDNYIKPLMDAMQVCGVMVDDVQVKRLSVVRGENIEGGCCFVKVERIEC